MDVVEQIEKRGDYDEKSEFTAIPQDIKSHNDAMGKCNDYEQEIDEKRRLMASALAQLKESKKNIVDHYKYFDEDIIQKSLSFFSGDCEKQESDIVTKQQFAELVQQCYLLTMLLYEELCNFDKGTSITLEDEKGEAFTERAFTINIKRNISPDKIEHEIKQYIQELADFTSDRLRKIEDEPSVVKKAEMKKLREDLKSKLSGISLLDRAIKLRNVKISVLKVQAAREHCRSVTWEELHSAPSGGENQVIMLFVFITLLSYIRSKAQKSIGKAIDTKKYLIIDNPFGTMSSPHLIKAIAHFTRKFNTQLFCLTDIENEAILNNFDANLLGELDEIEEGESIFILKSPESEEVLEKVKSLKTALCMKKNRVKKS